MSRNNQDYLYEDPKEVNLDHPDSAIRLACVVHRFRVPKITRKVNFTYSFSSTGKDENTRKVLRTADDYRDQLDEAVNASKKVSGEKVVAEAQQYIPLVNTILLSCKVQPEEARLDERLVFEWKSGVEEKPQKFKSEAIMYDLTMSIVAEGLGRAATATEKSIAGEFAAASKEYSWAAGVFRFLAKEHLPKWISKNSSKSVDERDLPSECHAPMAEALQQLFMANGQQMAIATLLMKEGTPNYSLVAKLCLGVKEQLDDFASMVRKDCPRQRDRMDQDFFTLVTLQINVQHALSLYFQGRAAWEKTDYGTAIAFLSEAIIQLRTRDTPTSDGLPDLSKISSLRPLEADIQDLRAHMQLLLRHWEKDNSAIFFERVPPKVPAEKKLQEGVKMNKCQEYSLVEVEPVLFQVPRGALERTDSDLARELEERLNAGENV